MTNSYTFGDQNDHYHIDVFCFCDSHSIIWGKGTL